MGLLGLQSSWSLQHTRLSRVSGCDSLLTLSYTQVRNKYLEGKIFLPGWENRIKKGFVGKVALNWLLMNGWD